MVSPVLLMVVVVVLCVLESNEKVMEAVEAQRTSCNRSLCIVEDTGSYTTHCSWLVGWLVGLVGWLVLLVGWSCWLVGWRILHSTATVMCVVGALHRLWSVVLHTDRFVDRGIHPKRFVA
jgi:hypothetical protein